MRKWGDVVEIPYRQVGVGTKRVRHPVLFGEYELTIDDKNRLLVPAEIRRAIPAEFGEAFFVTIMESGGRRVPWLYPEKYYEELVTQLPADVTPGDDSLALDQLLFAMTSKLPWDKQGRILIPDKTLKRGSIAGRDVTLIGARDHLELWNRADWEERREELERRSAEIVTRAKLARQSQVSNL